MDKGRIWESKHFKINKKPLCMSLGVNLGTLLIQVFEPLANPNNNVVSFSVIRYTSCCMATFNVRATMANARTGQVGQ